mmetsp:Transcript_17266/g.28868  ORF Transcript_17266/g.28868 Transcript_17266/m.28868 type:complete len:208 (-) Transcript_17266:187-810(-)|eukprot:CAMPEP_0114434646 /NCGR_PEP_ID=MMETSP0103-20121206/12379_1 /TAXON_ID=37642 ORGANISM="Paraphysomonas imperforata, Strain PA2" /NCGR_SAMPLE_ID=MMETSP0103 /ASSEMBLY_ACC=CAM_ASM_000201 /LENGTH=207 /DNA_ID=CAMNT_0001604561 /DNA_START=56 /DNA_END=679 /DNA_ORIENTATION=-
MSFTANDWSQLYDTTKRQIIAQRRTAEKLPDRDVQALRKDIKTLESQLKVMSSNLMEYEMVTSEIARRQTLLENLNKQMLYVAAPATGGNNSSNVGSGVALNPMQTTDKGLIQRQKDVMKLQDDMLVDIGHGVDRLHNQAKDIGEETKSHIVLLDNLEANVDDATDALQAEAIHAQKVRQKAAGCWMYICVAIEFVIIVLLLIIAYA